MLRSCCLLNSTCLACLRFGLTVSDYHYNKALPTKTVSVKRAVSGLKTLSSLLDKGIKTDGLGKMKTRLTLIFVICFFLFSACSEKETGSTSQNSGRITPDTTAPLNLSMTINHGDSETSSTSVTLSLLASDDTGVTAYFASESSGVPSVSDPGWVSITSTINCSDDVAFTLSSGEGTKTVYVWFKDNAGNVSSVASDTIEFNNPDTTPPLNPSVTVNFGDTETSSSSVTLSLSATDDTGVTAYFASENIGTPLAQDPGWTSIPSTTGYSEDISFTLSSGEGTKTVYVWFKDDAGNVSSVTSDTIALYYPDTTPPNDPSVTTNNGDSETPSPSVMLNLSAMDDTGVAAYFASESSGTPSVSDPGWVSILSTTSYSDEVSFTLSSGDGTKTVYVWFKDDAGNISDSAVDAIEYQSPLLSDTGQTTSYTDTTGEDADYSINSPSYTDNGDETVTDNNTLLVWQQSDDSSQRTWDDAVSYCQNLELGAYTDWRLPFIKELQSIADYESTTPAIDSTYFTNTTSNGDYWSSTTNADDNADAWCVFSYDGSVSYDPKSLTGYVRCVRRSGDSDIWLLDFSVIDNDVAVHDTTGLYWQREDDGMTYTWEGALSYCEGLSLGGYSDWRLPNVREMQSIVDHTKSTPLIDSTTFPGSIGNYWLSTSYALDGSRAWRINFYDGYVGYGPKSNSFYVRCVRGGQ